MSDTVIKVENVYKDFRLPHEKNTTVKSAFTNVLKGTFGKKNIETQHALKGINFEIKKGEFFGVVGRNGSGKSTLLKILAGIYQPTKGKVSVSGRVVPFIELGVGFNAELSGKDNVYLNGAVLGFSQEEVDAKYQEIVEFAELENFMDQKLKNYSSGMQVRLAFSVATILADSDILLIDEVLAVGDTAFQKKCFSYFSSLKRLKKTVVFVSHDMSAIREYCDKAVLIKDGIVEKFGTPEEVSKSYLKLFQKSEISTTENKREKRWGSGKVECGKIATSINKSRVKLSINIIAKEDIADPIVGFAVKHSSSRTNIIGTNSKIESIKIGKIKMDQTLKLEFEFQNILNDSDYSIDVAILDSTGTETLDWWESATVISGDKIERTNFPVQVPIKMKVLG